ncbi:MAG: helix-turn-helix domain-containing protein, partial [Paludibacteraceae bacterium]|nr:helix-turn-helix domain-containing protein [Paludibacteraceae bacterium]
MKRDINELKQQMAAATSGAPIPTTGTIVPYAEQHVQTQEAEVQEAAVIREPIVTKPEPLTMESAEEEMIRKALERHGGNRKEAAAELGISERTLYRKIKK